MGQATDKGESYYMPQLDGLRALAVLSVLYSHYLTQKYWLWGVFWGGEGVRLFFTLSGFLITNILLREVTAELGSAKERGYLIRQFYIRRYLRLTPVYYLTLAAMAALNISATRETLWWHVLYLSNVRFAMEDAWQGLVSHFWSLAVEEQFYLVWPFVMLLLSRQSILRLGSALVIGAILWRYLGAGFAWGNIVVWVLPPHSLDALALGAIMSISVRDRALSSRDRGLIGAALGGLTIWTADVMAGGNSPLLKAAAPTGISIFFAWLILWASEGHRSLAGRALELGWLTYIGKISYGLYVVHNLVWYLLGHYVLPRSMVESREAGARIAIAVIASVAAIALSSLLFHALESPVNRLRLRFPYRRGDRQRAGSMA